MRVRNSLPAIILLLSSVCRADEGVESSANIRERFLREAPECWSRMREAVDHLEGSAVQTRTRTPSGKPATTSKTRFSYFFRGKLRRIEIEDIPDTGARTALVLGPEGYFEANRAKGQNPYHLIGYGNKDGDDTLTTNLDHYLRFLYAGEATYLRTITQVLHNQSSRLTDVSEVAVGKSKLVRVNFDRKRTDGPASQLWVLLDPANQWRVTETTEDFGNFVCKIAVDYQAVPSAIPFPKKVVASISEHGTVYDWTEYVFDEPRECNAAASEFTLAAYGLPPISGSPGVASGRLLWWLVPTLVFLVIIFVIRRFRRVATH